MAQKTVYIPNVGQVVIAKRRGSRNIRLSIRPDGLVRVGLPHWAPYSAGIAFAAKRADWISRHLAEHKPVIITDGMTVGRTYRVSYRHEPGATATATRLTSNTVSISSPRDLAHPEVQKMAISACERALKADARLFLGSKLEELGDRHGFSYSGLKIKKLVSRWGSCSDKKLICLSYYLIQLPEELIDYVIIHELTHT
ncbi:MAG TPA: YgjP-like metallopeptidase domain-containing protein, partial [Candidatus Saccharimonadales bacterium]|nr:YgjP-like metallopeptidase domain-containing protein [Candidatus Saccharimonadales bacterium]